jgi:hypothetical protein
MKTKVFLLMFFTLPLTIFGQEEQTKTLNKISISEIYVQTGIYSGHSSMGTLTDFKLLAPQSILLNRDFSDYSSSNGLILNNNTMFSVVLGIQFSDKQNTSYKKNPLLRLGVTYFSGTTLTGNLYKENTKTYDTLTSTNTGQTVYMDSIIRKNLGMNYSSEQLRFDGSLIFRTNPEARWSLFTGIGVTAGFSFNAYSEIYFSHTNSIEARFPNGNSSTYYSHFGNDWETEKFRNKNNLAFSTYIPMGIDFRIGKKSEFWKQIHLFYEFRPGINMTSIPELRTFTNATIQNVLGLKVSW